MKKKHWYDNLWIWEIIYFSLGFFNILFAWLGMIEFLLPLMLAILAATRRFATISAAGDSCFRNWARKYQEISQLRNSCIPKAFVTDF